MAHSVQDGDASNAWMAFVVCALVAVVLVVTFVAINGGDMVRRTHVALNLPSAGSLPGLPTRPAPPLPTPPRS